MAEHVQTIFPMIGQLGSNKSSAVLEPGWVPGWVSRKDPGNPPGNPPGLPNNQALVRPN